jgi:hypothetical protein
MAKRSKDDGHTMIGTSFHGIFIKATPNQIIKKYGEPMWGENDGQDKVNMEWVLETTEYPNRWDVPKGTIFTIYDWKEYRSLGMDEQVEWHIGSNKQVDGRQATSEWENHSINILKSQGMSDEDIQIMHDLDIISDS